MKDTLKKMFSVLLVTHEQASARCARGSRALRMVLLLALTAGFAAAMGLAPRIVPALLLAALGGYALPAQA